MSKTASARSSSGCNGANIGRRSTAGETDMRFMTLVKSREGQQPPPALFQAIGELGQQAGKKMVWTGGLTATKDGALLRLEGGKIRVTDGPFSEAKEVIGG